MPTLQGSGRRLRDHFLTCARRGRYRRHNKVRDYLVGVARESGLTVECEPMLDPTSQERPDIRIDGMAGTGSGVEAWDVTVTHPLRHSNVAAERAEPGASAALAELGKMGENVARHCKGVNITFRPFGMETTGALGKQARVAVKSLVTRLSLMRGVPMRKRWWRS